ncbi:MAG TPA: prepilin-type N-terminal cleavage/methylation domain-containing protein [Acidimicrobiales bacterium]
MISSVISRLNDRRDAAADLGEDAGFTLIELMVVLLILAILLAIAIPTFLGVTGGANDRSAQSNLNTALTSLKTAATQSNQSYTGITAAAMLTNEPSLKWSQSVVGTPATVSTQGPVSFYISADGNGTTVVSFSKNKATCWWAVDNLQAVVDTVGPYGATAVPAGDATDVPTGAGTYYASSKSVGTPAACDPAIPPTGASAWGSSFPAAP